MVFLKTTKLFKTILNRTECLLNGTVKLKLLLESHLLVLQFDSHHTEAVVNSVVVDVDAAEALLARFDWHPFFAGVIIDHHRGSGLTYTLFTMRKNHNDKLRYGTMKNRC